MRQPGHETRIIVAVASCGLVIGCVGHRSRVVNDVSFDSDTSFFAAVVRVVTDSTTGPLRIDPRIGGPPEQEDGGPLGWVDAPRLVEMRRDVLAKQGVAAASVEIPKGCAGMLAAKPDHSEHRACPREHFVFIVIGLPRSTSPHAPAKLHSYEAVRVSQISVGPDGFRKANYEYILSLARPGWTLVSRVPLTIAE